MKTVLLFGVFGTLFMYVVTSMFNHTWDIMKYSQESTYWFGALSGLCWITGCLVTALDLDKPIQTGYKSYYKDL